MEMGGLIGAYKCRTECVDWQPLLTSESSNNGFEVGDLFVGPCLHAGCQC